VRRYGRITKYSVLQSLERKHITHIQLTLDDISGKRKKNIGMLRKLRQDLERSPMRLVNDACRSLELDALNIDEPKSNTNLLLRLLLLLGEEYSSRSKRIEDELYVEAESCFKEGIAVATRYQYIRKGAELRLKYVSFLAKSLGEKSDSQGLISEHIDYVRTLDNFKFSDLVGQAEALHQKILARNSAEEVRAIVNAMRLEVSSGYNYGTGANEHWYECPNGHPYFIGECAGAMQTSRCLECGATVGGQSHQLESTNRRWQQVNNYS
jgi:hypothetical protein